METFDSSDRPAAYVVAVEALPVRPVRRSSLLLGFYTRERDVVAVVLDADDDTFVRLPGFPPGQWRDPLSLSPDGRHLVCAAPLRGPYHHDGLYVHAMATGVAQVFDSPDGRHVLCAALAPDGRTAAVLTTTDDRVVVDLLDTGTRRYRRLWTRHGGCPAETTFSWNTNGTRLATTYYDDDLGMATLVTDVTGNRRDSTIPDVVTPTSGNGGWLDDDRLILLQGFRSGPTSLSVLDADDGSLTTLGPCPFTPQGRLGSRLIMLNVPPDPPAPVRFEGVAYLTVDLDGGNPRPFLSIDAPAYMSFNVFDTWMTAAAA
jgi:hypothetical protein